MLIADAAALVSCNNDNNVTPGNDNIYTVTAGTLNSGKGIPVGKDITTCLIRAVQ